jgi:hypothetical protein
MAGFTKEEIIKEIRRTAKENKGFPLGSGRFEKETGINPWQWGQYWARFGDLQKEAGFEPNKLQTAYDEVFLIEKLIELIRRRGKFPTLKEIVVERNTDTEIPSKGAFRRLGTQHQIASKIIKYCTDKKGLEEVIEICQPLLENINKRIPDNSELNQVMGEVYLFRSGRYYKIGKTNDTVRRGKELRIQLPEACILIHSIKTDDPNGIVAYWHKRFDTKRLQGEWFDLNSSEVKAFRQWKKIV